MTAIPYKFAASVRSLSWKEIDWGCRNGFLDWKDAIDFAIDNLTMDSDPLIYDLSMADPENIYEIQETMKKIIVDMSIEFSSSKMTWLIITMAWAYHNRESDPDILGTAEQIYADFDYPSEIESIIRYMPPVDGYDPAKHSIEQNEERLIQNWRSFIGLRGGELQ